MTADTGMPVKWVKNDKGIDEQIISNIAVSTRLKIFYGLLIYPSIVVDTCLPVGRAPLQD